MKISTALFASIVAICCTVTSIYGQIIFNDGTSQKTSFNGPRKPRPQSQYAEIIITSGQLPTTGTSSFVVPNDQELVILSVNGPAITHGVTIRSQSSSTPSDIFDVVFVNNSGRGNIPDGTVVIDEERKLIVTGDLLSLNSYVNVLGYIRKKSDFHPYSPTRFSEHLIVPIFALANVSSNTVVPVGEELVILQFSMFWINGGEIFLSSQDPLNPGDIVDMYVSQTEGTQTFPDGTMVVGEGRRVHVHSNNGLGYQLGHAGVSGYFRDK